MRSYAKYIWIVMFAAFVGGFLLAETSGLLGRASVTTSTVVATVNGEDIPYMLWQNTAASMAQTQEQQSSRGLTLDERHQIDDQAFDNLVNERLLQQEYDKRGIRVTDEEVVEAAKFQPPPQFMQTPELQTDGQFDPAKYQRFLASPGARQGGILQQLEGYYRTEIPKEKLFTQVAGDVFVSETRLWQIWCDSHDSATVSFVAFPPVVTKELKSDVSDAEIQSYYDAHKAGYDRRGRAVLSIVELPRKPTSADSLALYGKMLALRAEIEKGAKFDDVARRESDDSVSGKDGGKLPKGQRGRFVKAFEDAAYKLKVGELSQPVVTQFGMHLIRVDERKGDTISVRHILKILHQGDSAATATDRRADQLAKLAAGADVSAKFDSAARSLGLLVSRIEVHEGEPASYLGRTVPSASAWAFSGARIGESSDLFDDDQAYDLVRLDSLQQSGVQPLSLIREEVREAVAREKALDVQMLKATSFSQAAKSTGFESAVKAEGLKIQKEGPFARTTSVPSLGGVSAAVGAAFGTPAGAISPPIRTETAVFVMRTERRVEADRKAWSAQLTTQRAQVTRGMRDQRIRLFLDGLRKSAKIDDRRKQLQAAQRRQTA